MFESLLVISILAGQLVKFPLFGNLGPTLLDFYILFLVLIGLIKPGFKLKKPPIFVKLGLIFSLIAAVSLIFTPLSLTLQEYLLSFSYTIRWTLYIVAVWIIFLDFTQIKKRIYFILITSGFGLAILGLLQFLLVPNLLFLQKFGWDPHYFRTASTFLDPNFAGAYFGLSLLLLFDKISLGKIRNKNNFYFLVIYLALLTTFSRSSYLMFLVGGLSLSFLRQSKIVALICMIGFLFLLLGFQLYGLYIATPRGIDRKESASSRIDSWLQGLQIFNHSQFLGVGFNSYRYAIRQYNLGDGLFLMSHGSTTNDSSLLYVAATTGVVGFLSYVLFLSSLIKYSLKGNPILIASFVGVVVHSFFANSLFYPPILLWILLLSFYNLTD